MVKFSVLRIEEDDDEEITPSAPEIPDPDYYAPKRRRLLDGTAAPSPPRSSVGEASLAPSVSNPVGLPEGEGNGWTEELECETINSTETSKYVVLSDPDVLDCTICFDPLTIPVYQCENGHIACSSCCINCKNVCASCSETIGQRRCRAIENVLESIKISCLYKVYGCQAKVSYCNKLSHEETCPYAPYPCPFQYCIYRGSLQRLSDHLNNRHSDSFFKFRFNSLCALSLGITEKFRILQEEESGALFILNVWDKMAVKVIPSKRLLESRFAYALVARGGESSLRFQSFTETSNGLVSSDDLPSKNFCLVPEYFFNSSGCLQLELCIWSSCKLADIANGITVVGRTDNNS